MYVSSSMKTASLSFLSLFIFSLSSIFAEGYSVVELEGDVLLDRPGQAQVKFDKDLVISKWDRISIPEKAKFKLKTETGDTLEFSKNSVMQFVPYRSSDRTLLRLLKGRVRIENQSGETIQLQTLNSVLKVPFGKTDVIISAMNTLVAPREGKNVRVGTKKVSKLVGTGFYGLVMSDGTFIKTAAAQSQSKSEENGGDK